MKGMRSHKKIRNWILIGVSEIVLSLVLISIAPRFLNSKKPGIGFAIWFAVPTVLTGSGISLAQDLLKANRARSIFVTAFPEYSYLGIGDFLGRSPLDGSEIELLTRIKETEPIQELDISLFEILEQMENEKT